MIKLVYGPRRHPRWALARAPAIALVAAIAVLIPWHATDAQIINRYGGGDLNLSREDLNRLGAAAAKVSGEPKGAVESWSNPASGNSGTVRLVGTTERDGMPCQAIEHVIKLRGYANRRTYQFNRCQQPDGQWKLY